MPDVVDTFHTSEQYNADLPLLTPEASSELYAKLCDKIAHVVNNDNDKDNAVVDVSKLLHFDLQKDYKKIAIDPFTTTTLAPDQLADLQHNIKVCRHIIVFFTSCGAASGYGGHTGGAYDTVPEVVILDAFFRARPDRFVPIFYDEAGHRVATQYLMAALDGYIAPEFLRFYRFGHSKLPGHPELGLTPGIQFSSGRLGHLWATVNGIALANPGKSVILLGSDGSQMEGNNAEAARLAVAKKLNVKLCIDDNNVTITGHPSDYLPGYDVQQTLQGHGLKHVSVVQGEDVTALFEALRACVVVEQEPAAVICRRKMAPGIPGVEGTTHGHDTLATKYSIPYLEEQGHTEAAKYLKLATKTKDPIAHYKGSSEFNAMRKVVGATVVKILQAMDPDQRRASTLVVDSDLGSSTNFAGIETACPEIYCHSGVMERGNFAAAAGFGMHPQRQGVFSTFAAFLEMLCSEITMARLNRSNVFSHFSHSGVDDMSDNTCHFGLNHFFADNGLNDGYETRLYFPADPLQAAKVTERTFPLVGEGFTNKGLRFVFTTRSKTPILFKEDGITPIYGEGYEFVPGKDEVIRPGSAGYVVSFGDALYRALDAVETLRAQEGIDIGLINKPTLNVMDETMMETLAQSPLVLVSECLGHKTGLGSKFGSWLMETKHAQSGGLLCKFGRIATHKEGVGGLWEQAYGQGYDSASVQQKVKQMLGKD
mmetsp:Transcript_8410/g.23298  ORF Transcript_8410/g.23298 Transcript_8410/m.23298 type:complete len:709 (+) Transcript_8410:2-2128(+)